MLRQLVDGLAPAQLAWLSGYAAGVADQPATPASTTTTAPTTPRATILYGTQSGNARAVAERLQARLQAQGQRARLVRASDYATRELKDERLLLVVISTQGDGDPPEDSRGFCEFVLGKRAPALGSTRFAVLGLGDSTYPKFNHAARVLDDRLAALGAARLCGRAECDVDFAAAAERWSAGAAALLQTKERLVATTPVVDVVVAENATRDRPITATVLMNQRLTSAAAVKGAAKETRHVELSTPGLRFTAGDALGVWPENPPFLVDELLKTLGAARDNVVTWGGKTLPLSTWFSTEIEITRVTPALLKAHRSRGGDDAPGWQVVDVVRTRPSLWTATDLIAQLRPLVPRLYSIASSPLRAPDEVHLTVAHVDVVVDGRRRVGAASHFLSSASEEAKLRVFVEVNDRFRLPKDDVDIVMIGPGTGVAPFRAFLQEREERGAKGRNWLFFGEQRFTSTFLYQVEWQEAVKRGTLHKIDLAFSRDQPSKIYVQDRMREQARDLWSWLQAGAVVYVCGDAKHMAPDVERALLDVARGQGGFDDDGAADWLSSLREQGRYLRDIY
ncbi:MAG: flavodoxin domain-containing protein [Deltaproteobacteria bacterium]|nr:flavodoxin domain-containing protein [Deltaproteobacteria bacterium]